MRENETGKNRVIDDKKLQGFLPYQTNKDRSQKTAYTHQKKKCYDPYFFGRAEILLILGLHFGGNADLINSF